MVDRSGQPKNLQKAMTRKARIKSDAFSRYPGISSGLPKAERLVDLLAGPKAKGRRVSKPETPNVTGQEFFMPFSDEPCFGVCQMRSGRLPSVCSPQRREPTHRTHRGNRTTAAAVRTSPVRLPAAPTGTTTASAHRALGNTASAKANEQISDVIVPENITLPPGLFPEMKSRRGGHSHYFRAWVKAMFSDPELDQQPVVRRIDGDYPDGHFLHNHSVDRRVRHHSKVLINGVPWKRRIDPCPLTPPEDPPPDKATPAGSTVQPFVHGKYTLETREPVPTTGKRLLPAVPANRRKRRTKAAARKGKHQLTSPHLPTPVKALVGAPGKENQAGSRYSELAAAKVASQAIEAQGRVTPLSDSLECVKEDEKQDAAAVTSTPVPDKEKETSGEEHSKAGPSTPAPDKAKETSNEECSKADSSASVPDKPKEKSTKELSKVFPRTPRKPLYDPGAPKNPPCDVVRPKPPLREIVRPVKPQPLWQPVPHAQGAARKERKKEEKSDENIDSISMQQTRSHGATNGSKVSSKKVCVVVGGGIPLQEVRQMKQRGRTNDFPDLGYREKCEWWLKESLGKYFPEPLPEPNNGDGLLPVSTHENEPPPVNKITLSTGAVYYTHEKDKPMPHWDKTTEERCKEYMEMKEREDLEWDLGSSGTSELISISCGTTTTTHKSAVQKMAANVSSTDIVGVDTSQDEN